MTSERAKMIAGELYDPHDAELVAAREHAQAVCRRLIDQNAEQRREHLAGLFASGGGTCTIVPPFFCDYGFNIHLGEGVYFNTNCVVLDVCPVRIGTRTLIAPAVQLYTASHPMDHVLRRTREFGRPITIGEDCWIGGGAIVLPGVTVGDRTIVGAGSVVTKDLPSDVVAAGNPCRVLRDNPPSP